MNAVKNLNENDHFCDLAPPREKIKIPGSNVHSHVNKMLIREKSYKLGYGRRLTKILRLIFGTFLEVGQPIPNMENNFFQSQRFIKTLSLHTKYNEVTTVLRLFLRRSLKRSRLPRPPP